MLNKTFMILLRFNVGTTYHEMQGGSLIGREMVEEVHHVGQYFVGFLGPAPDSGEPMGLRPF